jgi:hypothetical protein
MTGGVSDVVGRIGDPGPSNSGAWPGGSVRAIEMSEQTVVSISA